MNQNVWGKIVKHLQDVSKKLPWVGYDRATHIVCGAFFHGEACVCAGIQSTVIGEDAAEQVKAMLEEHGFENVSIEENPWPDKYIVGTTSEGLVTIPKERIHAVNMGCEQN